MVPMVVKHNGFGPFGLKSELDEVVHYTRLNIIAHESELVKKIVNGFVVGTVIDVPFAENTIRDVIEFTFYHQYVHDITEEEVAFSLPFARYRYHPMDKFKLACAGVHFGIDKLIHVFVINIVVTYNEDFTFEGFRDYLGLWGGNITDDQDVVLRLLEGLWDFV
ncbi:hypothetical protein Tco_1289110 [Tanacetum coccineum]